jgi:hypothetical protein
MNTTPAILSLALFAAAAATVGSAGAMPPDFAERQAVNRQHAQAAAAQAAAAAPQAPSASQPAAGVDAHAPMASGAVDGGQQGAQQGGQQITQPGGPQGAAGAPARSHARAATSEPIPAS